MLFYNGLRLIFLRVLSFFCIFTSNMIRSANFYPIGIFFVIFFHLAFKVIPQKIYSTFDFGYNLGLANQNITSNININNSQASNTLVKGSFGSGLNLSATTGYLYKPNFSFELGLSYSQSQSFDGNYTKDTSFSQQIKIKANMLRFMPGIRIALGEGRNKMFVKIGAAFRLAGQANLTNIYIDEQSHNTTVSEWKYFKGFSLGAYSGIGFTHKISEKISFYGDALIIVQSWSPKYGDVTKYSINGTNMVETLLPGQQHIHFVDQYTVTNGSYSNYAAKEQLKQYYSFSSLGLKIGIIYYFTTKNEAQGH